MDIGILNIVNTDGEFLEKCEGDITILAENISLESESESLEGMVSDMTRAVGSSLKDNSDKLVSLVNDVTRDLFTRDTKIQKIANGTDFTTVSKLTIHIPDGFKGVMSHYSKDLAEVYQDLRSDILPYLDKSIAKLSYISENKNYAQNLNYSKNFRAEDMKLQANKAKVNKYFSKSSSNQVAKVGTVFGNWAEIIEHESIVNSNTLPTKALLGEIQARVDEISRLTDIVREDIKSSKLRKRTRSMKDISGGLFVLAMWLEFFALVIYSTIVLDNHNKINEKVLIEGSK